VAARNTATGGTGPASTDAGSTDYRPGLAAVSPGFGAPGDAVLHELGGLQLVAVGPGFYQISAYRLVA